MRESSPKELEFWLRRAADAGDAEAEMFMFSSLNGSDDPAKKRLAMNYLHRAADHGSPTAHTILGELHRDGAGVVKDTETARQWFKKGARAGDVDAILVLCDMAAAERDLQQCRECLLLENGALTSVHPESYSASQLKQQRMRIEHILNEQKTQ